MRAASVLRGVKSTAALHGASLNLRKCEVLEGLDALTRTSQVTSLTDEALVDRSLLSACLGGAEQLGNFVHLRDGDKWAHVRSRDHLHQSFVIRLWSVEITIIGT